MQKTFIGPHLRRLRQERGETQSQMAKALGISASYVNLLENNERSVSVAVMLRMFDVYGVDWREIADEDGTSQLADLRAVMQDPLVDEGERKDGRRSRNVRIVAFDVRSGQPVAQYAYQLESIATLNAIDPSTAGPARPSRITSAVSRRIRLASSNSG